MDAEAGAVKLEPGVRGPLGIPRGSVRASLALCLVYVACMLMVRGEDLPLALSEALFAAIAYYFAARSRVTLTEKEFQERQHEFGEDGDMRPLYMPRGTVRVIIIFAFVGVAVYVVSERGWASLGASTTLLLVVALFAGQALKWFINWLKADRPRGEVTLLEHVKAALGITVGVAFVVLYTTGMYREANPRVHKLMLGFVIFYFGSR
ncbi:hypothetical protein HQ560_20600 [bacterium]|nr:hypothetical protein [bacterium]